MADNVVLLSAPDNQRFTVPRNVAVLSLLVATMVEDGLSEEVPLLDVKGHVVKKVIEFSTYYVANKMPEIEKPLKSANLADVVPEWYAKFIDMKHEELFELILAANYMDNKPLLDLASAKVASMIKGKKVAEIRTMFNIKNDFTPEEEAQVREGNKWAEEA